jgi:hypothetical protein
VKIFIVRANAQLIAADYAQLPMRQSSFLQERHRPFQIFGCHGNDDP